MTYCSLVNIKRNDQRGARIFGGVLPLWDGIYTIKLREGDTVAVYRIERYNHPNIRQVGLTIEQPEVERM